MKTSDISAIILSAGFSSRMKRFKPMLPIAGKPMVERAIELFKHNGISDIVVITGHNRDLLEPTIKWAGGKPVFNPLFEAGMFSSIQKGVASIRPDAQGFFLLPVDIPAIRKQTIENLIDHFCKNPSRIVMPCFEGKTGHPPLIPSCLKNDILSLGPDVTLRDVLFRGKTLIHKAGGYDRGILMDADDPKEFDRICRKIKNRHIPDKEECLCIINDYLEGEDHIQAHLADVSMTALKIAGAVKQPLNYDLIVAAALLHDIKRKEKEHARKGADLMKNFGFCEVADIISQHMDIELDVCGSPLSEKEIVYFADKLCNGKGLDLNYHKRFLNCVKKCPWAITSISKRYGNTQQIQARIEAAAGRPLESIFTA